MLHASCSASKSRTLVHTVSSSRARSAWERRAPSDKTSSWLCDCGCESWSVRRWQVRWSSWHEAWQRSKSACACSSLARTLLDSRRRHLAESPATSRCASLTRCCSRAIVRPWCREKTSGTNPPAACSALPSSPPASLGAHGFLALSSSSASSSSLLRSLYFLVMISATSRRLWSSAVSAAAAPLGAGGRGAVTSPPAPLRGGGTLACSPSSFSSCSAAAARP
mmetsp:Transcript_104558/g.301419  ORF Transcript_104558/g.301419 Transcript_104558/m.301419 type:complete len:223 (-) Transcript_104558:205-873(-)